MTPKVLVTVRWKHQATELVAALHAQSGITSAALIAELLAISERYALVILTDLGVHQPRQKTTAAQALERMNVELARRVRLFRQVHQFRNGTSRAHDQGIAA